MAPRSLLGTWLGITTSLAPSLQGRGPQGQASQSQRQQGFSAGGPVRRIIMPSRPVPPALPWALALALARVCGEVASLCVPAATVRDRWLAGRWAAAPEPALLCFPGLSTGPASCCLLSCVFVFPTVDMPVFWAAPCVRIYYIHGQVRAYTPTHAGPAGLLPLPQPQKAKLS